MNAYFFRVSCYQRKKLTWQVEFRDLSKLARFILCTEQSRVKSHSECTVIITRASAGIGQHADVLLDQFDADIPATLKSKAMEYSK